MEYSKWESVLTFLILLVVLFGTTEQSRASKEVVLEKQVNTPAVVTMIQAQDDRQNAATPTQNNSDVALNSAYITFLGILFAAVIIPVGILFFEEKPQ